MEQYMASPTQQGSDPLPQAQQQGQSTAAQQPGVAKPAPKPVIRDWAAI
jgi:hypothetical protein